MKIAIASDHAGFELKKLLISRLLSEHEVEDLGTDSLETVDYPQYGWKVGEAVVSGRADRGIVICGSGIGISLAANTVPGIRASVCHDTYSARMAVEHNNLNVLSLGARVIAGELSYEVVKAFLGAHFLGGIHQQRLNQLAELKQGALNLVC